MKDTLLETSVLLDIIVTISGWQFEKECEFQKSDLLSGIEQTRIDLAVGEQSTEHRPLRRSLLRLAHHVDRGIALQILMKHEEYSMTICYYI